ncbi:DNA repair protein XRCC2 [Electrophorus electricus]|uniref:RecA family profile 1 domain-containing protein n=1 Tax=Electrophorus electricus TaxID=8005 RepID=A0A4W4GU11_ELEEL|nr:DNA repair protein XRCC2 [Electrophorus electricus]
MTSRVKMAESALQLLARVGERRSLKDIDPRIFPENGGPVQGDVVEFHGVEGSGKTETLYHLMSRCLLPVPSGGLGVDVVFVDTDYHFDMLRLVAVLEARVSGAGHEREAQEEEEVVVRSCLRRLSVVHCSSSTQLLLTLHYLEGSISARPDLSLLVVDSISAFYWVDRSSGGDSLARQEANLRKSVELLNRLRRDYGTVVFATTHAIMRNYASASSSAAGGSTNASDWRPGAGVTDFDKPYLCRIWQRSLTHRLLFSKSEQSSAVVGEPQVFSVACTAIRTKGVKRCAFHVTEGGVVFL